MHPSRRRKKAGLIRSLLTTSATTVLIATGGFGSLPRNDLSASFQQVMEEYIPVEITQFIEPYFYTDPEPVEESVSAPESDFPFNVPIAPPGRTVIDPVDRFGEIQRGALIQYGVDFVNSTGTPVLAAADGTVVFAGWDEAGAFSPSPELHGQLVILEHQLPEFTDPVFTFYSHLSEIRVGSGEAVAAGEVIGLVGSTGQTTGSELYFEIRFGENNVDNVRNPELWLKQPGADGETLNGALAGRILDAEGNPLMLKIVVRPLEDIGMAPIDLYPYTNARLRLQPPWMETFAVGNLPPGEYKISFALPGAGYQSAVVEILPGRVTRWEWVQPQE